MTYGSIKFCFSSLSTQIVELSNQSHYYVPWVGFEWTGVCVAGAAVKWLSHVVFDLKGFKGLETTEGNSHFQCANEGVQEVRNTTNADQTTIGANRITPQESARSNHGTKPMR